MFIELMQDADKNEILSYMLPYEKFSVTLYSEILHGGKSIYVLRGNFGEIHGTFLTQKENGKISAYSVLVATAAAHKNLEIPGEAEFSGRGVIFCSTCDGPFFRGGIIVVVGGGDSAC